MSCFHLIMKSRINDLNSPNTLKTGLSKEELAQLIRTNFGIYTEYIPPTNVIADKIKQHMGRCSSSKHYFYEVVPVCSQVRAKRKEVCILQSDMFQSLLFMKHLSTNGKKLFLDKHLFNILLIDTESLRFYLDQPHFETSLEKLITSIAKTGFVKDISLKKYKKALEHHMSVCDGPCKLNTFGFPICKKSDEEICTIEKMYTAFYIFLSSDAKVTDKQFLFDMIYIAEHYDRFLSFICTNMMTNKSFHDLVKKL